MAHNRHLIDINHLSREDIEQLITLAEKARNGELKSTLTDKIIASCFFEASTRTRLSFESAIHRLGARIIGFSDSRHTSFGQKGENLEDTIYMLNAYADAIVIRHPEAGSAERAANVSDIPIINAGDGANQHPTQTLLDLYTIKQKFTKIDGLKIAVVGDLKYGRTVHSLAYALMKFNHIELYCIAPNTLKLPHAIHQKVKLGNVMVDQSQSLENVLSFVDVVYMTRLQKERFTENTKHAINYQLTRALLEKFAHPELIVLHPLPRVDELCSSVDQTQHAWYFKQAKNGVYMREALLHQLLAY